MTQAAPDNLFDQLKVENFTLYKSPVDDGGAALVFKFEKAVELDDDAMAFPLDQEQMIRLLKLVVGWASDRELINLDAAASRLVKMPHEL